MSPINDMGLREVTQKTVSAAGTLPLWDPEALLGRTEPLFPPKARVQVWSFSLEGSAAVIQYCRDCLSSAERHRADRFVFPRDRIHHTIAHGVLRHLLGRYLSVAPGSLGFSASPTGKPALLHPAGTALHFNLSHSDERALLGVSADHEMGVDLEKVRSNIEALAISRHYFFGSEREAIESAPLETRDNVFFRYWVAKEAVLKAQGVGLGFPLDRFRVDFLPGGHRARIETLDPGRLEGAWTVRMLPAETGWPAAVAARGEDWDVVIEGV
jgi:4'-phosphopantetheinyl transferase